MISHRWIIVTGLVGVNRYLPRLPSHKDPSVSSGFTEGSLFVYLTGAGWFWVGHSLSLAQFWGQSTELIFSAIAYLRQVYSKGNTQQFFLECSLVQPAHNQPASSPSLP